MTMHGARGQKRFVRSNGSVTCWGWLAVGLLFLTSGCSSDSGSGEGHLGSSLDFQPTYPGEKWQLIERDHVADTCHLDPRALEGIQIPEGGSFIIVRYGKVCWADNDSWETDTIFRRSATKTLAAVTLGLLSSRMEVYREGRAAGLPIHPDDRLDKWLPKAELPRNLNPDSTIEHVLAMVSGSSSLMDGDRQFRYENGPTEILKTLMEKSIESTFERTIFGTTRRPFAADLEDFVQTSVFAKLGMRYSTWNAEGISGEDEAEGWHASLGDMARLGLLLIRDGVWEDEMLLSKSWIDRMTHPPFMDANPAYGYLTWLNVRSNWETLSSPPTAVSLMSCAPTAVCRGDRGRCPWDVGVWSANGAGGHLIVGHKGLDLLVVAGNLGPGFVTGNDLWMQIVPAVAALDPIHCFDSYDCESEPDKPACLRRKSLPFCREYANNRHAPALAKLVPTPECRSLREP